MSSGTYRPALTSEEVEQNINHIVAEGIEGETVLDVHINPGIEAGPFLQIDVENNVIVLPFSWKND